MGYQGGQNSSTDIDAVGMRYEEITGALIFPPGFLFAAHRVKNTAATSTNAVHRTLSVLFQRQGRKGRGSRFFRSLQCTRHGHYFMYI